MVWLQVSVWLKTDSNQILYRGESRLQENSHRLNHAASPGQIFVTRDMFAGANLIDKIIFTTGIFSKQYILKPFSKN